MNELLSLCLLASAISAVVASTSQPVPVLAHSNQPTFLHASSSNVMYADDFSTLVHDIIAPRQSSLVSASTPAPEVLLAVVYDKLDFATLAREMGAYGRASASPLSEIKPAMSSATSSLTIPYAHPSSSYRTTTATILSTVASATPHASRIIMGGADTSAIKTDITRVQSCTSLLSHLTSHPTLFNNGITDVIVISITPSDTCVAELLSFISSQQTTHVVMYTAEQSKHDIHMTFGQVHSVSPVNAYQVKAGATDTTILRHNLHFTTGPTRLTPNILIGILVMIFLLFMLYLGVNCLMAIERPVRMSSTVLQISKEY